MANLGAIALAAGGVASAIPTKFYTATVSVGADNTGRIAGYVTEATSGAVSRCVVRLYYRPTGALIAERLTSPTGAYSFSGLDITEVQNFFLLAFDPDGGTQYNLAPLDRMTPKAPATARKLKPLQIVPGVAGALKLNDPQFSSVSLLLHGNGADGGSTITDSSSYALTATQNGTSGNVVTSNVVVRYGSASLRFAGSQSISFATSSAFEMNTRNFTTEAFVWVDPTISALYPIICQLGTATGNRIALYFTPSDSTLRVDIYSSSTYRGGLSATGFVPSRWYHVALTKSGNTYTLWLNGVSAGSVTTSLGPTGNLNCCVGWQHYGGNSGDFFKGYMDEVRITAGAARYSATFTPPAAPLPDN